MVKGLLQYKTKHVSVVLQENLYNEDGFKNKKVQVGKDQEIIAC